MHPSIGKSLLLMRKEHAIVGRRNVEDLLRRSRRAHRSGARRSGSPRQTHRKPHGNAAPRSPGAGPEIHLCVLSVAAALAADHRRGTLSSGIPWARRVSKVASDLTRVTHSPLLDGD